MGRQAEHTRGRNREAARLEALARVAGAAAPTSELGEVLEAMAAVVEDAFGLEVVVTLHDPETGRFTVRAVTSGPAELLGTWSSAEAWDGMLQAEHEIARDVFFISHDAGVSDDGLGAVHTPDHDWSGPGHWHPLDMCFVRMRTSSGR